MKILLSNLAQSDLDEIRQYTIETWGRPQWLRYYSGLVLAFERISKDPSAGQDRRFFVDGMRSLNYEKHTIFFKASEAAGGVPVIMRIVHQRRNMAALVYYEDLDID